MAEQIPFSIIADVLTKLGSSAVQQIGSAFGVAKELTKLTEKLDTIRGVLLDAEEKQEKSHAVKAWVRRLKDVVYDADDLLDDFATHQLQRGRVARQVSDFFSSSNQLVFRFEMSNRVNNIKEAVDEIVKQIPPMLNVIQGNIVHRGVGSSWRETHSFVLTSGIVGREEKKEEIIKSLVSSDNQEILSMVAIVGIGGLGKTTLAQLVYNAEEVERYFEPRIWICVSDNFDVKSLVKKILKEVCEKEAHEKVIEKSELNGLKNLLHEKISQKRCLLVLDDVWNESSEEWEGLKTLLMVVGKGSKILVTTRQKKVASIMGINSPFLLEGLKDTLAWDLFSKIAFTGESRNPELVKIGKEIANMCNGVPLVIKTLGSLLRLTTEEREWQSIKDNKNLLSLGAQNDSVLAVLKLSYDNLPINLKQCFTYCALFPKDHEIEKKLLVQLWMAQGYIQPLDENIGHRYFQELLSRSLLEESKKDASNIICYKMHDLIHDLAQSVIGAETLILEDDVKEISNEVRHVSLFNSINLKFEGLRVKHLRTFLSIHHEYNNNSIRSIDFSNFKCLRVLSLNGFNVKKLPKSLGKLSHLRYLDLSYNEFEVLPNSITRLKNLQTLKLLRCHHLKKFPRDIGELINLRHWENDRYSSYMPCGIGELTQLQSLPVFVVENVENWRGVGRLSELKGLNNLKDELSIEHLENVRDVMVESREANLRGKKDIRFLALKWPWRNPAQSDEDAETLMEGLHPPPSLEELRILGYPGMRYPSWMRNGGLSHLKSLVLSCLDKVEYVWCSSEGQFFPFLEKLHLKHMPKLKELWRRDLPTTPPPPSMPNLSRLKIKGCKLASLELDSFPRLSQLKISDCVDLSSLELHSSPSLSKLEILKCGLQFLLLPPSPHLSQLSVTYCTDLASLELHSSPLLSKLDIHSCPKLTTLLLPQSPCLSKLEIQTCGDLTSVHCDELLCLETVELQEVREVVLRQLMTSATTPSLGFVSIRRMDDLMSLPDELHQHGSTLHTLKIWQCPRLATLPDCIGNLTSLTHLEIGECPQLASLPERMRSLTLLTHLDIWGCPQLTSLPEGMVPSPR